MNDKFYVLRSGRVLYAPGHRDLAGARAVVGQSVALYPKRLHQIVQVIEEYEQRVGACVECQRTLTLSKSGSHRRYCGECAARRKRDHSRETYKDRIIRENERDNRCS